ncbi:MAG: hypothetical protein MMC33_007794 [Icmadophila ericetorum]|nr:hypothetical protein [Icmadophila ericetorum]
MAAQSAHRQPERPPPLSVTFTPRKPTSFPVSPFKYRVHEGVIYGYQVTYHSVRGFVGHVRHLATRGNQSDALGLLHGYLDFEKQRPDKPFVGEPSMDFETAVEQVKNHAGMEYDQRWIEYEAMVANPEFKPPERFHEEYIFPPPAPIQWPSQISAAKLSTASSEATSKASQAASVVKVPHSSSSPPNSAKLPTAADGTMPRSPQPAISPRLSCPHCKAAFSANQDLYRHVKACQPQKSTPNPVIHQKSEPVTNVSTIANIGPNKPSESALSMDLVAEPATPAAAIEKPELSVQLPSGIEVEKGKPGIESGVSEVGEVHEKPKKAATDIGPAATRSTTTTAPLAVKEFKILGRATSFFKPMSSPSTKVASAEPTEEAPCYDCGTIFDSQKTMHRHYAMVHLGYIFENDRSRPPPSRPKSMKSASPLSGGRGNTAAV